MLQKKCARQVVLSILIVALAGCDTSQPQNQPAAKPHYQRFVPIPPESVLTQGVPWNGFLALDTKTGTLCRTIINRVFPSASGWANDIPACSQVLAGNPD
jgi:hypothetical protein